MHNPSKTCMKVAIRFMRNLKSAFGKGLMFSKHNHLDISGCTDVHWIGYVIDRKSTSSYFIYVVVILLLGEVRNRRLWPNQVLKQNI